MDEFTAAGLSPDAARREALRRFGDLEGARAYCRTLDRGRARQDRRRDWRTGWRQDLGFAPHNLGVVSIAEVAGVTLKPAERDAIQQTLLEQSRALPGVESAALTDAVPPRGGAAFGGLEIEGRTLGPSEKVSLVRMTSVAPEFFGVLQQQVRQGTSFTADTGGNPWNINETMARRYWPGTGAIGRHFRVSADSPWLTVVGVVGDIRIPGRRGAFDDLQLYASYSSTYGLGEVVVRTRGDQATILRTIQRTVVGLSSPIRLRKIESVDARMTEVVAGPRFSMARFAAFAVLALVHASIGLYGVISYSVGQQTREIGVRIVLGAGAPSVIGLVVGQGQRLTLAGVVIGLARPTHLSQGRHPSRAGRDARVLSSCAPSDPGRFGGEVAE